MSNFTGWLTAKISVTPSLAGTATNISSLAGTAAINEMDVLDVFDYFKTEDNIHFLVTESGEHLGFY
jgi:hypothetical protein